MKAGTARALLTGGLALGLLLAAVPAASASFHIMKIREVSGDVSGGGKSYVELQMYTSGQTSVDGHVIDIYDEDAHLDPGGPIDPVSTCVIDEVLPTGSLSGGDQRTVLVGDSGLSSPAPDAVCDDPSDLNVLEAGGLAAASGAICFEEADPPDCASWGSFDGGPVSLFFDNALPFGGALPTDGSQALRRKITGGSCATRLEVGDDTNNTAADFELVTRDPTPNSSTPVETPCSSQPPINPGGTGPAAPTTPKKKKCKKPKKRSAAAGKKKCKKK